MRQKMVTLCDKTWLMAMEKKNFSEWVRGMLLAIDEDYQEEKKAAIAFKEEHGRWPRWWIE